MNTLHADLTPSTIDAAPGQQVRMMITVSNLSPLIDGYSVRVFGLDPLWVDFEPRRLSLFPGDSGQVETVISLPADFPAGLRLVSVYVQSENSPSEFVIASLSIDVASTPRVTMTVDPQSQTVGGKAQFGLVVSNHGNSTLEGVPDAVDPEDDAEFTFTPSSIRLMPGEQDVIRVAMRAPRPWVGTPKVRVLTFGLNSNGRSETIATLIQRPRIGRSVITLLGLITAAAVFAAVLSRTLSNVVDQARVKDQIIEQALSNGATAGPDVVANPASISGTVRAGSSGTLVAGVQVGLFTSDNPTAPVKTSASSDTGAFRFAELPAGTYRVRFSGAGFSDSWFKGGRNFSEATDIPLKAGENLNLDTLPTPGSSTGTGGAAPGSTTPGGTGSGGGAAGGGIALVGVPGTVSGTVIAPDPTGATATLVIPGIADPTVPAVVATVDVSANGAFSLPNIPTPQTYTLIVSRHGNATETRTIELAPGASATGIEITLRIGEGVISGSITGNGAPVGGALIEASDGVNVVSTVSLTEGKVGTFALRNLAVPGVYTITVTAKGFAPSSQVVELKDGAPTATRTIFLSPATGAISGTVRDRFGLLGGVTVTVDGPGGTVVTKTSSQGKGLGTFTVPSLAVPGSYTITFSKDGYLDQVQLVPLDPLQGPAGSVDAILKPKAVSVIGTVTFADGTPAPLANVSLSGGTFVRAMLTASQPSTARGHFEFGAIPPGSYTFTANLVGTEAIVFIVNVTAGQQVVDLGNLALGIQASISGTVTWAGTQPAGAEVRLYLPADFPPTAGKTPAVAPAVLDASGRYQFIGVAAPASYVVAVFSDPASFTPLASDVVTSQPGVAVTFNFSQVAP